MVEPWLRGTLTEFPAVTRQVLHALELAEEDIDRWCSDLTDAEVNARPAGVAPVAYHLRHIARSLDRLLTYAEDSQLNETQLSNLKSELDEVAKTSDALMEFRGGLGAARERVIALPISSFEDVRRVGRGSLPSTVGGLLVHCAEHTQRHVGQAITTVRIVRALRA